MDIRIQQNPVVNRFTWIRRCFTFCVRCTAATTVRCFSRCDATTIIASPLIGRSILHATHIATSSVTSHLRRAMRYHRERGAPQRTSTRLRAFVVRDYTSELLYCATNHTFKGTFKLPKAANHSETMVEVHTSKVDNLGILYHENIVAPTISCIIYTGRRGSGGKVVVTVWQVTASRVRKHKYCDPIPCIIDKLVNLVSCMFCDWTARKTRITGDRIQCFRRVHFLMIAKDTHIMLQINTGKHKCRWCRAAAHERHSTTCERARSLSARWARMSQEQKCKRYASKIRWRARMPHEQKAK